MAGRQCDKAGARAGRGKAEEGPENGTANAAGESNAVQHANSTTGGEEA